MGTAMRSFTYFRNAQPALLLAAICMLPGLVLRAEESITLTVDHADRRP